MRVFVWEYCCAVAEAPESLRHEGRLMLSAVLTDLTRCPGVEAVTVADGLPRAKEEAEFRRLCRTSDGTLVIAPESDGILFERCRMVEEEGGRLLGPDSAAVRLTGDKLELSKHLKLNGVPTPPCELLRPGEAPSLPFPLVCKPRDGAGSVATFLVRDATELDRSVGQARAEGFTGEAIVQPFVSGESASVALLIGPCGRVALPAAEQRLSADGRFRYLGGRLPLAREMDRRARPLAQLAAERVAGLRGYVGVDLVLGETAAGDAVIEINPRLTTSYVGLRALAKDNLAAALLTLATGATALPLRWRRGPVEFGVV
jgi:predicted ATP-grasp superfamily ATP-dependent carboligase